MIKISGEALTQQEGILAAVVAVTPAVVFGAAADLGETGAVSGVSRAGAGLVRSVHHHY